MGVGRYHLLFRVVSRPFCIAAHLLSYLPLFLLGVFGVPFGDFNRVLRANKRSCCPGRRGLVLLLKYLFISLWPGEPLHSSARYVSYQCGLESTRPVELYHSSIRVYGGLRYLRPGEPSHYIVKY